MTASKVNNGDWTWKCCFAVFLATMCPFQYGVDFGLIAGIQAMVGFLEVFGYKDPETSVGWNISAGRQQLISSLMTLGAVIASGFAGPLSRFAGRKTCIWAGCFLCAVSDVIMMTTKSIGGLYAGRLLIGLGNGLLMTFSQLYINEVSPAKWRGLALASFMVWTSVGTLIGTVVDNFTSTISGKSSYIIPLGIIYVVPFFISVGLFFVPESPRWLIEVGRHEAAAKSMRWLRSTHECADAEVHEVQTTLSQERELHNGVSVWDMFRGTDLRRTIVAVAGVNTQAASGAIFIIAYGTYFFEMADVGSPFPNACILVGVGVVAILINSCVVTKLGRRRVFLITGLCLCGLFQLIIAVIYTVAPAALGARHALVALTCLYIVSYNGCISTYAWVSGAEIPSQRLRSYTFGLAASLGFFGAWLATFTAPYFINPSALNWGPKYGYIWAPSCAIAAVFVYFYMPEVMGRSLEEVTEMFEARIPARKFRQYKCVGAEALGAVARAEKLSDGEGSLNDDVREKSGAAVHVESA